MRILVIDDSRAVRHILSQILTARGFEVVEAGNGFEALRRLEEFDDIVLACVDWNMPNMGGHEFVTAVRSDAKYDRVKLMMVTTEVELSQMSRALEAGADEYVMKPFTQDVIHEKLALLGLQVNQAA